MKLSEAESVAADAIRGDVRWSEWLRVLVRAAVEPVNQNAVPVNAIEPVNLNPVAVNLNGAGKPVNRNVTVNQNEAPKRARAAQVPPPAPVIAAASLLPSWQALGWRLLP